MQQLELELGAAVDRCTAAEEAHGQASREAAAAQMAGAAAAAERDALLAQLEQVQRQHHADCMVRPLPVVPHLHLKISAWLNLMVKVLYR